MRTVPLIIFSAIALTVLLWLVGPIFGALTLNLIGSLILARRLVEEVYGAEVN